MKKIGIDLGSRFVKIAVDDNGNIEFRRIDTIEFYKKYIIRSASGTSINTEKLGFADGALITATGYGRNLMSFSNATIISEIKAHFKGAEKATGEPDFTLIDIGGQDSKVILSKGGVLEDFVMNDKCAASTGRFAENACNVLGITLDELSDSSCEPANLSSTCAVFCESEIIGLMASGAEVHAIAAGVNKSIARRLYPLIKPLLSDKVYASGGVAENKSLIKFLSELLQRQIIPIENPQFNGAIGCLHSMKKSS